jgi:hypothetical protein
MRVMQIDHVEVEVPDRYAAADSAYHPNEKGISNLEARISNSQGSLPF